MKNLSSVFSRAAIAAIMVVATVAATSFRLTAQNQRNALGAINQRQSPYTGKNMNANGRGSQMRSSSPNNKLSTNIDQAVNNEITRLTKTYDLSVSQVQSVRVAAQIYFKIKLDPDVQAQQKADAKSTYDEKIKSITAGAAKNKKTDDGNQPTSKKKKKSKKGGGGGDTGDDAGGDAGGDE